MIGQDGAQNQLGAEDCQQGILHPGEPGGVPVTRLVPAATVGFIVVIVQGGLVQVEAHRGARHQNRNDAKALRGGGGWGFKRVLVAFCWFLSFFRQGDDGHEHRCHTREFEQPLLVFCTIFYYYNYFLWEKRFIFFVYLA